MTDATDPFSQRAPITLQSDGYGGYRAQFVDYHEGYGSQVRSEPVEIATTKDGRTAYIIGETSVRHPSSPPSPIELFKRCAYALCGDGPKWKEQFGLMLGVKTDSIDAFAKGEKRIPPGVWSEISTLIHNRRLVNLELLETGAFELSLESRKPRRVAGRNVNDGLIQLAGEHTETEVVSLQKSLDTFTKKHGLTKSIVGAKGKILVVNIRANLTGTLRAAYEQWLNAECDRIDRAG